MDTQLPERYLKKILKIDNLETQINEIKVEQTKQSELLQKIYVSTETQKKDIEIIRNDYGEVKGDVIILKAKVENVEKYVDSQKTIVNFLKFLGITNILAVIGFLLDKLK